MPLRLRALPAGFVPPCLPTGSKVPPSGKEWLHEIKHDGFRVIARKIDKRVRLYSRPGNDLTYRFPLIKEALLQLRPRSCIIDGEAVSCGADGIASFDRIRYQRRDTEVFLYAFDLVELNGDDLRRDPLEVRKATLERLLARAASGLPMARGVAEMCVDQVEFLAYKLSRNRDHHWWTGFSQQELRGTLACLRELERILAASSDQQRTPG
jgi:ATP-dependent DNA ligase